MDNTKITIKVKHSADNVYDIEIDPNENVGKLKELLAEKTKVPANEQKIIFKGNLAYMFLTHSGKILKDGDVLSALKVENGSAMHMVKKLKIQY